MCVVRPHTAIASTRAPSRVPFGHRNSVWVIKPLHKRRLDPLNTLGTKRSQTCSFSSHAEPPGASSGCVVVGVGAAMAGDRNGRIDAGIDHDGAGSQGDRSKPRRETGAAG